MSSRALAPTYEPNPLLAYAYRRFFDHIQVDESWVKAVRDAAATGSVVYILRNLSFLDFLALDHLTKRHGFPASASPTISGCGCSNRWAKGGCAR